MSFMVSPGVLTTETDMTSIIPSVSTSNCGMVGAFRWGPVNTITQISHESEMVRIFGKPDNTLYLDFMCATQFLSYASSLNVVRVIGASGALNATDGVSGSDGILIKNLNDYNTKTFSADDFLFIAKCPGAFGDNIGVAWTDTAGFNAVDSHGDPTWPYTTLFSSAPSTNEFHIVVYDASGVITGTSGTILETWPFVSSSSTALSYDGTSAYVSNKINNGSQWLWVGKVSLLTGSNSGSSFVGGADGDAVVTGDRQAGVDLFADPSTVDISLFIQAGGDTTTAAYIVQDLASVRKDCVAFVSPAQSDVVGVFSNTTQLTNILATRTSMGGDSSYGFMDSAWKLTYDRYNNVNRWVPLNGDIAGLCAQTDQTNDPWFSPAGLNRGLIKNCIALSTVENQAMRDTLYQNGINPIVNFPINGPVLYGDKTLQARPSAFDRINVRRLFIVLEKAIATAAKYQLFELNDAYTQAAFVNMVEPFLRSVQGGRGITGFRVVCDSTNNTPQVVDSNRFVGSIYIKPPRSINYITLNFVAVATGVSFDEVVQGATAGS